MKEDIKAFMDLAAESVMININRHPKGYELLNEIDQLWKILGFSETVHQDEPLSVILVMNGHSIFRASLTMALSGHTAPIYPLLRNALESCLFAFRISHTPSLAEVWSSRHTGPAHKKRCIKEFSASLAIREILNIDENLGKLLLELYEASIDFGAHPNVSGVSVGLDISENDQHVRTSLTYLHGDSFETDRALLACAENGRAILYLIRHILAWRANEIELENHLKSIDSRLCPELFGVSSGGI